MNNSVAAVAAPSYDEEQLRLAVRTLFSRLGYPAENPLAALIKPGDTVFIKPNWVAHRYRASCKHQDSLYSTITHPALIRVVADFVAEALQGRGEIRIGDNPSIDADFEELLNTTGLRDIETRFDCPCRLMDLRPLRCGDLRDYGNKDRMIAQPGDPLGSTLVNLGDKSLLYEVNPRLFRGVFTDRSETVNRHTRARQDYEFSTSIVSSDVYISLPKMKTHHKCGTTLNLKGLVGTQANKNLLVHWRVGWSAVGGDEHASFTDWVRDHFEPVKKRGAWSGNDTIWRMVVDLFNAFNSIGARRTFSIVDGVLGGEGDGPFCPVGKAAEVLVGGEDMLTVDLVTTRLMGFDPLKIPYLAHLVRSLGISLGPITLNSNVFDTTEPFGSNSPFLAFKPPTHWDEMVIANR